MTIFATNKGQKPSELKTFIHNYHYDISNPKQNAEYKELTEGRRVSGVKLFGILEFQVKGNGQNKPDRELTLETAFTFGNQWDTADGYRIFDWSEIIYHNPDIKSGYYIDITPEMIEYNNTVYKCGYCGHEFYGHENKGLFCPDCLDSEYLKEDELHLLRLLPVSDKKEKRAKLTEAEKAEILPFYVTRQTTGNDSRNANKLRKQRERIESKYLEETENAKIEHDGLIWLLDNGANIDNVIYYSHTGRFCFGWRNPLSDSVKSKLLDLLCEFPFDYDIK